MGYTPGFWTYHNYGQTKIDGYYATGLLIIYDSPHQHIWTYTMGYYDNLSDTHANCPCASPSPFIGANYYCESGTNDTISDVSHYFNDPLWDGSGCITSNCCDNTTQPWFYRQLSGTTTSVQKLDCVHIITSVVDLP